MSERDGRGGQIARLLASLASLAWPGAALGSALAAWLFAVDAALRLRVGFGLATELVMAVVLGAAAVALLGCAAIAWRLVLTRCPALLAAGLIGPFALVVAILYLLDAGVAVALWLGAGLIVLGAAPGGALALIVGTRRHGGRVQGAVAWTSLAVSVAAWAVLVAWLSSPGAGRVEPDVPAGAPGVAALAVEDPSNPGRFRVRSLTYGSGDDRRRPEYAGGVSFRSRPVDGTRLVENLTGLKAVVRRWYWGFGPERLPLNGRVFSPEGDGPFPLVLIVHGNHQMEDHADPGFAYLAERLASRGFLAVSVDENFLNRSWSGDLGGEQGARGWLLLQHLAAWRRWNETPGHPFHRRVDMERIALIGHSRGGEAVGHAAVFNRLPCLPEDCSVRFDFGFAIRALVALAPTDGGYRPAGQAAPIENVSYLLLAGTHDGDVSNFQGLRAFKRVRFTDRSYRFKAAVNVGGANHDQFNTVLGDNDLRPPFGGFARRADLLGGADQRRVATVLIGGFLEATLNGRREYVPMFRDVRAVAGWLPRTAYWTQFEDSSYRLVSDFGSVDLDRATLAGARQAGRNLTVWRQAPFKGRGNWPFQVPVVYLGWDRRAGEAAGYRITLPETAAGTLGLDEGSRLVLVAADARDGHDRAPVEFTLELRTADGVVARVPLSLPPTPRVRFTKWPYLEREFFFGEPEPLFQTSEIPLAAFGAPGFSPARVREIGLVFDRTASGTIVLSGVGFTAGP